jgi:hypothetical protein
MLHLMGLLRYARSEGAPLGQRQKTHRHSRYPEGTNTPKNIKQNEDVKASITFRNIHPITCRQQASVGSSDEVLR